MAGIFAKTRILVLSNVHKLLDKAIKLDSVEAVKQYLRDVEVARDDLDDAVAGAKGGVKTVERKLLRLTTQANETNATIDVLLCDNDPSNDSLALPLEGRLKGIEAQIRTTEEELADARMTAGQLEEASVQLNTKFEFMVGQLDRLESMDRTAKAKEAAAKSMKGISQLAGGEVSVDDVSAEIERRKDVADARFDKALGNLNAGMDKDVLMADAAASLEARKQRLTESGHRLALPAAGETDGSVASDTVTATEKVAVR